MLPMPERRSFEGMLSIARYNWPWYVGATFTLVVACFALLLPFPFRLAALAAMLGALWFLVGSLLVSHWVYDRSPLYRWQWMKKLLVGAVPDDALICVAGFDEASTGLRATFSKTEFQVLDHYDAERMTEASIHRARKLHPPGKDALVAPFGQWPALQTDLVIAPLSIHEFRSVEERAAWFAEAKRALKPGGRILVIEHVRDLANFIAFGPGFLHFHSCAAWRESWEAAGLKLTHQSRLTPFLRIFILQ